MPLLHPRGVYSQGVCTCYYYHHYCYLLLHYYCYYYYIIIVIIITLLLLILFITTTTTIFILGLRFGDQILQINDETVAGYSMDKVHDMLKKSPANGIRLAVRDR